MASSGVLQKAATVLSTRFRTLQMARICSFESFPEPNVTERKLKKSLGEKWTTKVQITLSL